MRISDGERKRAVAELREASTGAYRHIDSLDVIANSIGVEVDGKFSHEVENETYAALADLIDRPMCHDLVEHKHDPFIPGKRMADGYFHCSSCDWSGQLWEYIGFGDIWSPALDKVLPWRASFRGVCEWRVGHL